MALHPGTKLGPYEIVAPLGAGGMGEVYRAKDTRLDRTVALKILASHLSVLPELKQRFEREARTVSSLNHKHICHLYDIGSQDGIAYLVMEYLEGETLAERLRKGPLSLIDLLKTGTEIAEALEVAHRAGIIHRDLKPGNIMLTKSGAKLMDFGLAKPLMDDGVTGAAPLLSAAQTISGPSPMSPLTTAGTIVGTIQYMSPEQIEGKEVDARADIFSLGAVLYEMATGKRAFEGKTQMSVASAILEKEPEPISARNPMAPASLDYLVTTCLVKDREERIQAAHDVRLHLNGISRAAAKNISNGFAAGDSRRKLWPWLILAGAGLLLCAAGAIVYTAQRAVAPLLSVRSYIPPPTGTTFRASGLDVGPVAVSPDGKTLAFSAVDEQGVTKLWLRPLDAQQARMLAGTDDAAYPFWSPDSRYLGFIADGKLKKISSSGGDSQLLADGVGTETGVGTWGADGTILFCKELYGAIYRVAATGGEVSAATKLGKGEVAHLEPFFLPDGQHFLYVSRTDDSEKIRVAEVGKPEQKGVEVVTGRMPKFASGYLLFVHDGHIQAQSFDDRTWTLSGDPQALGEAGFLSASTNGVLAYHEGSGESELRVYDRNGNLIATPGPLGRFESPRFSPDGKSIGVTLTDPRTGNDDIWIYPVTGGRPGRLTFGPSDSQIVWSPDGKEIAYMVDEDGKYSIRRRPLDGSRPEEILYTNEAIYFAIPVDWSPDGKSISVHVSSKQGVYSNWILPVAGGQAFRPEATSKLTVSEYEGKFSFDGGWLSYFAYETGRPEVYVVPFPAAGKKFQVSTTGGWVPRFSHNELFYVTMANRLMVAKIHTKPSFGVESIRPLFQMDFPNLTYSAPLYDVSPDGQRIAVLSVDHTKSTSITLLTNWPAGLKKSP